MPRVKLEDHANAKQKIKEIKTSLKAMRESDKEYANKQFDLADLYLTDGQYTEAVNHFKMAVVRYEDRLEFQQQAEALSKLCDCYHDQGRYKEAQSYLKRKLKLVVNHFTLQSSLETAQQQIYFKLGLCYYLRAKQADTDEIRRQMLNKADESLKTSLKFVKDAGDQWKDKIAENQIWESLAMVHKSRKDYKKAIECLKIAVPKMDCFHEDNIRDYMTIAHCYAKLGKYKRATVYLEKTVPFMKDMPTMIQIRARIHADLGDYYFQLKEFEKSALHYRENLRIFKQTRFDREKFENAAENLRNAKKAVKISKIRQNIAEKLTLATKKGDKEAQIKLLEKSGDYAYDLSDEHEAIAMYKKILPLCEDDISKTLVIHNSIGNAYEKLAEKEASKEHAKTAIEYYTKNYDICKNESKESGMADALNHKAVVLELEFLNTDRSEIFKEYNRAAVLANRSKNYSLAAEIYENIAVLYSNWKGKEEQAEEYEDKAAQAKEKVQDGDEEDELEIEDEDEEEIEENDKDDEDLKDLQGYFDGKIKPKVDAVELKTKLSSVIERAQERQKKRSGLVPLQEGEYDKKGNLLPAYRDDFIVDDDDTGMDPSAKRNLKRILKKDEEETKSTKAKKEPKKEDIEVIEVDPPKSTKPIKIEDFITNVKKGNRKPTVNRPKIEDLDNDDGDMTPYQAQRKRQREMEEFGDLEKDTAKKRANDKKENTKKIKTQHTPQEQIVETPLFDKQTGRRVLQNKGTGKILRSFKDDWIVQDGKEYDSDDLNADFDSEEEEDNPEHANLPAYTKDFIVDG